MWNETIAHGFELTQFTMVTNMDGIDHEQSLVRPAALKETKSAGGGNCLNWNGGHILATRAFFGAQIGIEPFLTKDEVALYDRGSSAIGPGSECVSLGRLAEGLEKTSSEMIATIRSLSSTDLEKMLDPEDFPMPVEKPSLGSLLTICLFHESYHAGQIGICRRLVTAEGGIK